MKKIGIIGSGAVAKALAKGFIKYGYSVKMGTRDLDKLNDWKSGEALDVSVGSFNDAANFGDIIILAVKGVVAREILNGLDPISDKIVIDPTNPIDPKLPPVNGVLQFFTERNSSLMEELQSSFPQLHFVKAFNSVGSAFMVDPKFPDGKPSMFICGNNDSAKAEVAAILDSFGWIVEDMGKVEAARAIESLCMLWCIPGFLSNQWSHAFKLIKMS